MTNKLNKKGKISLKKVYLLSLLLIIVLPLAPLTVATFYNYYDESSRLEEEQITTNLQIAILSERLLEEVLLHSAYILTKQDGKIDVKRHQPFKFVEQINSDGIIEKSNVNIKRIGEKFEQDINWKKIDIDDTLVYYVSNVREVAALEYPSVILRVNLKRDNQTFYRVAYLDPYYMYDYLTSAFETESNRHVYAVDANGTPMFYSSMDLMKHPEKIRHNPSVEHFMEGKTGYVRYTSSVSNDERIGWVYRMDNTGWGIIVSVDIGSRIIRVQDRMFKVAIALMFAVFLALIVFLYFSRRLILPLVKIAREIRRASLSEKAILDIPEEMLGISEFDNLVKDFNIHMRKVLKAEELHIQTEKMASMGEVAAGLAHEIGTPLGVIRGNAQYLLRKFDQKSEGESLEKIVFQTERIAGLIRNLLDLARPDKATPERFDISKVIEKSLKTVREMCPHVEIVYEKEDVLPMMKGYPGNMEHVFLNLFINACHAMDGYGTLGVMQRRVKSRDEEVIYFIITDTGCGIDTEQLKKIFKPFYSTKGSGRGTGLGLAIVERVVKEHNGSIYVESEEGKGATFYITFPLGTNSELKDETETA